VRAAHLAQYRLDPLPRPRLLLVAGFATGGGFLSRLRDGFCPLRCEQMTCESRNLSCIHLCIPSSWRRALRHAASASKRRTERFRMLECELLRERREAGSENQRYRCSAD
jgi:hypothetical protein